MVTLLDKISDTHPLYSPGKDAYRNTGSEKAADALQAQMRACNASLCNTTKQMYLTKIFQAVLYCVCGSSNLFVQFHGVILVLFLYFFHVCIFLKYVFFLHFFQVFSDYQPATSVQHIHHFHAMQRSYGPLLGTHPNVSDSCASFLVIRSLLFTQQSPFKGRQYSSAALRLCGVVSEAQ